MTTSKIPKKQAKLEIGNRQLALSEKESKQEKEKIKKHKRTVFETQRAYPFLADFVSYCCTDNNIKKYIKDNSAKIGYHYTTGAFRLDRFFVHTLYEPVRYKQIRYLRQEIMGMFRKAKGNNREQLKYISTNNGGILGYPFIVTLEHGNIVHKNLIGKNQTEFKNIEIQFLKYLWEDLIEHEKGKSWFPIPKHFYSKILHVLENKKIDSEVQPIFYRNMFMYFNLIDNSTGKNFSVDREHFVKNVCSQHLEVKNEKTYIHNWYKVKQLIEKGIMFFEKMESEGLMSGSKIKLQNVYFDKASEKFKIQLR